jgi:3-dehydroquinate dehydratase/shikimate dehydrogenase
VSTPNRLVVQTLVSPDDAIDDRVDLVELRLDLYPDLDVAAFCRASGKPVIATVRRVSDGGRFDGTHGERVGLFAGASAARYFDLEFDALDVAIPDGVGVVRSLHDTAAMPRDLDRLLEAMLLRGGDLFKLAVTPSSATEALYCAAEPVAPGMPTPGDLFDGYGIAGLSPTPQLFGVAGDPVAHSESPGIHNPAFRRDGIDAVYLRFLVADLAEFWPAFVSRGGRGLSVTAPLKQAAARLAASPDEDVRACGAANTLLADGRAANTDLRAFLELVPAGRGDALVMGAGGSARAAVVALRRLGYRVRIWARRPEQATELGDVASEPAPADVVVNTTPAPAPATAFLVDLRYGPDAASETAQVDGRAFLRAQARHQYHLFTGGERK